MSNLKTLTAILFTSTLVLTGCTDDTSKKESVDKTSDKTVESSKTENEKKKVAYQKEDKSAKLAKEVDESDVDESNKAEDESNESEAVEAQDSNEASTKTAEVTIKEVNESLALDNDMIAEVVDVG